MERFERTAEAVQDQEDLIRFRDLSEKQGMDLVLFGAGECGHKVYGLLHDADIEVCCFCDNRSGGRVDEDTKVKIVSPDHLKDRVEDAVVLICVVEDRFRRAISGQLLEMGFDRTHIFDMRDYYDRLPVSYFTENIERYRDAYRLLEDDRSREVYLEKIKKMFLSSGISQIVSPQKEEYFDEIIELTDEEVFIDCGGFDGDTAVRFAEECHGKYKDIVIFEPESEKKDLIEKNMQGRRYELYQAGVWSTCTRLYFDALGTVASRVSEKESGYVIDTVALDEVVYDKAPTFIKMDIEGAEQEALKGCRRIIKDHRPKMAICIYHRPEDMFEIPFLIKEINPEYRLYVRQYADAWYDTVLYAL